MGVTAARPPQRHEKWLRAAAWCWSGPGYKVHSTPTWNWVVRLCSRLAELLHQVQRSRCDGCSRKTSITSLIAAVCTFMTPSVWMYLMHRFFSKVKHRNEVSVRLEIPQRGRFTEQCSVSAPLPNTWLILWSFTWFRAATITELLPCLFYITLSKQPIIIQSNMQKYQRETVLQCSVTSDRYLHFSQQETLIV